MLNGIEIEASQINSLNMVCVDETRLAQPSPPAR